jgi:hypothetical protein
LCPDLGRQQFAAPDTVRAVDNVLIPGAAATDFSIALRHEIIRLQAPLFITYKKLFL